MSRRGSMITMALAIIFAIAIMIRAYAAKYGFYLNEFDPYYDYYAAQHVVTLAQQHGLYYALFNDPANCGASVLTSCHNLQGYFYWHDIATWFPYGRNVAATSQDGLQLAGAGLFLLVHNVFGVQITLYDFLVLLPVFLGGITAVLFYFLVRRIAGEAAGLFAALMFAVSPPLIERGNLGWFKSEPLAIFLFVCSSYLVLSVFDRDRGLRSRILRATVAGLLAGYAETAWGGSDYFTVAFGLLFLILPFINQDLSTIWPAAVSFTAALVFDAAIFPRPGVAFVTNPAGLAIIGGTTFLLVGQWCKSWVKPTEYRKTLIKFLFGFTLGGLAILSFGLVGGVSLRYLAAIAPWARTSNALVQSVAEQAVPTGQDYFTSYLILLSFGVAGTLIAFRRRNVPTTYALIIGLTGLYISAAYSRLLVYSSIALGLLAGIGFAELVFSIVKPTATPLVKKKPVAASRNEMKVVYSVALILLIAIPAGTYWIPNPIQCTNANTYFCDQSPADAGVSLTNGATTFSRASFDDWTQTLQWIRQNTPTDAVVIGWWDYGYWITVMGNRTTVDDNATLNATRIAEVGQMYMSNVTTALRLIRDMAGDRPAYVILFLTGSVFQDPSTGTSYYLLQVPAGTGFTAGGGDESKKQWFIRIGGLNESQLLECVNVSSSCPTIDDFNLTPYAIQNTLFGQLLPFQFADFLVPESSGVQLSSTYEFGPNGTLPVEAFAYPFSPTFPYNSTGPIKLAYASPSMASPETCPGNPNYNCFNAILVYKVNDTGY
ncbi:MAG TPA: STT3 domain-containing protein [Nitrososphaerales archaeon]|nr:STT3 domain-containing protein [Nitrososphaerales archaeon]